MAGKVTHSSCKSSCLYSTCCAAPHDRMCSRYKIYFPQGRRRSIERQRQNAPPVDTEETHWAILEAFKWISIQLKWSNAALFYSWKQSPQQIKYLVLFIVLITFRKAAQVFEENWKKKKKTCKFIKQTLWLWMPEWWSVKLLKELVFYWFGKISGDFFVDNK